MLVNACLPPTFSFPILILSYSSATSPGMHILTLILSQFVLSVSANHSPSQIGTEHLGTSWVTLELEFQNAWSASELENAIPFSQVRSME